MLPTHREDFFLVAHPRIAHDHQHVTKRLFAERQKLGFDVGVDDALPCMLLHELDFRSGLDSVPFLGFSKHPAKGAECVIVI
jgi:hypothetical protein